MQEDSARFSSREVSTEPKCFLLNDRSSSIDQILQRIGQWPDSDASPALLRDGGQSPSFTDTKYSSFVKAPGRRPIPDLFVSVIVDWYAKDYKNWP